MYPKSFIERLREALPVSEVIGKRVPIKKKGREWEACCPFHQEKTPSFFINDAKGFYHCFGCSAHGDNLKFLMEFENLSYPEAIEALAAEANIPLPELSPEMEKQEEARRSLQDVMALTQRWFAEQLQLVSGEFARDYLTRRGLPREIIAEFGIGFAPDDRQGLRKYLASHKIDDAQMLACGLLINVEGKELYSRFRGRIMFPILDAGGEVIAFGGRALKAEEKAKYLNSPETELFHKGNVLYNWKRARSGVRDDKPMLVAEGYMDVIALHQAGFSHAVAPLGTALTEPHLRKLWQSCDAPILCLDGDNAGQRAMWRSAELALPMLQPGKTLRFCVLPAGQDPDDLLKSQGSHALQKLLDAAQPLSQVIVAHVKRETGTETPEQRASLESKLEAMAAQIEHASLQQHFRRYFREQLWAKKGRQPKAKHGIVKTMAAVDGRASGLTRLQQQLFKALLCQSSLLEKAEVEEALSTLRPSDTTLAEVQGWLLETPILPTEESWPDSARQLKQNRSISLPEVFFVTDPAAHALQAGWQELLDAYTLVSMRGDLEQLQQDLAADMSEEKLAQMLELKQQIQTLNEKRYAGS